MEVSRCLRGPLDKELDGLGPGELVKRGQVARSGHQRAPRGQRQWRHGIDSLSRQVQRRAAGGQDGQAGSGSQEGGQRGRGIDDLLEVVEDEQKLAVTQGAQQPRLRRLILRLPHAQDLGDHRENQVALVHRRQRNEGDAAGDAGGSIRCHPQREARLAGAAGSGEGEEPDIVTPQKGDNLGHDVFAPNEGGRRCRQGVCLQPRPDVTPDRPRATFAVALDLVAIYMEGTALLRGRQLTAANGAADGPLVDAEQPRGLARRQCLGHTTGEIWALPLPGVFPLAVGVRRRLVAHGSGRMIQRPRWDKGRASTDVHLVVFIHG
jgi:hypothetical protein